MCSLHVSMILLAFLIQSAPRPEPFAAELKQILAAMPHGEDGWPLEEEGVAQHFDELWSLVGRKAASELQARPDLGPEELVESINRLDVEAGVPEGQRFLSATAVRLAAGEQAAYAIALEWAWTGTILVVARRGGVFQEVWNIKQLAREHFASRDELGRWAYLEAGYHDGPISGAVHVLPAGSGGRARFYVDALSHPEIGLTRNAQISVWQWDGTELRCLFIQSYMAVFETQVRLEGNRLIFRTKSVFEKTGICGSCRYDAPMDVWTLELTPAGLVDLGRVPEMPELPLAEHLLARRIDGKAASELATPEAIAELDVVLDQLRDPKYGLSVGMLHWWNVETVGGQRVLEMGTDDLGLIGYTIGQRGDRLIVTSVKLLRSPG